MRTSLYYRVSRMLARGAPRAAKSFEEVAYWRNRVDIEGLPLLNNWYEETFTSGFRLPHSFYEGKRMLDIGCGPRGSLEWAEMAAERVGLDPLVAAYEKIGIGGHKMRYVKAGSEAIPLPDSHFDVVSTFNSLDHVVDLDATIAEIVRVTRPGGTLLLLTDVNHPPTVAEPQTYSWDIIDRFEGFRPDDVRRFERHPDDVHTSIAEGLTYDDENPTRRYGVLLARMTRI